MMQRITPRFFAAYIAVAATAVAVSVSAYLGHVTAQQNVEISRLAEEVRQNREELRRRGEWIADTSKRIETVERAVADTLPRVERLLERICERTGCAPMAREEY